MDEYIYLDNAATTPVDKRVLEAMLPFLTEKFGNASSVHKFGREAKVMLEDARDIIAGFIGARSSEISFTSGGTEANNFALKGIAFHSVDKRKNIVTSKLEHSAVLDTLEYLHERFGFNILFAENDKFGKIIEESIEKLINDDTLLVSIMHSNNELGIINNINKFSGIAKSKGSLVHSDTVQSLGKTGINVNSLNADTLSFSAHKIYGPKGVGALYIRKDTPVDKLLHGGKQERDRRGGTENIAAIAGFKKAVEILKDEMESDIQHYEKLRNICISLLTEFLGEKIIINADLKDEGSSLKNILNISFEPAKVKTDSDAVLVKLDLAGIAVSSGSACTSGSVQPSHVLKAIGYDDALAKSSLRISFGRFNTTNDVEKFVTELNKAIG